MLNQVVLVGRIVDSVKLETDVENHKITAITLSVPRSFKNADGIYENDFIKCIILGGVAENTSKYCKKDDIVGIKGRIESRIIKKDDGTKNYEMELIAEKVTFLSSKKE